MKIVVFGAGGRAGRAAVVEARRRGHEVTPVVRAALAGAVVGDVREPAALVRGQDAVVHAAADLTAPGFFAEAAEALVRAGAPRLVAVGLASVLPTASGVLLMDTPGYPQEYRDFYLSHAAGVEVLRASELDWVMLSPAGDFDHGGPRRGGYRVAAADAASRISYADFVIAVVDEIERPRHREIHLGLVGDSGIMDG
jgi:putative NADH-flavin reductase